jgi:CBS domain-containing protein
MTAARKVAALKRAPLLFVERGGRLIGAIDERALADAADDAALGAIMAPIGPCLDPAMSIARARDLFSLARLPALPVAVGTFLLGAVTRGEVEQAFARTRTAVPRRTARFRDAA